MRIYTRDAFLALPPGTLFCKGKPWYFGRMAVKGASLPNDFYARDLCWVMANTGAEQWDAFDAMLEQGASVSMQAAEGRDGCCDEADLFLVYEASDLEALAETIQTARAVAVGVRGEA
jgi:hypothetical protein